MSKLIFCYGAMNSGKSMQLLTWKYNYEEAGYKGNAVRKAPEI